MAKPPRVLAVVGWSPERWDDYASFNSLAVPHDVCCINRAGWEFPGDFKFWFSYHSTELRQFAEKRPDVTAKLLTTGMPQDGVWRLKLNNKGGSSSLQAARVARRYLGYDKVVMCGVSLRGTYRDAFFRHWAEAYGELVKFIRSMSGSTMELLGEPTREWLEKKT